MSEEQQPPTIELASPVIQRVELLDVRVTESSAHRACLVDRPMEAASSDEARVGDSGEGRFRVSVRFEMNAVPEDGGSPLVTVSAVFDLEYGCEGLEDFTEEQLSAFARLNGVFNAWPYWREFVQSMTTRMGLPALVLPVYRISGRGGESDGD